MFKFRIIVPLVLLALLTLIVLSGCSNSCSAQATPSVPPSPEGYVILCNNTGVVTVGYMANDRAGGQSAYDEPRFELQACTINADGSFTIRSR